MPFCVKCGKELSYSDKFCSACGKENAEYRPDSGPKTGGYDITITPKIRLYGPQDAKTEIELYIPQLGKTMYLRFPNYFELGQTLRAHGEGLTKPNGEKGDLLITPTEVEYYDTELTISARLVGATDAVTKMPLYLPHIGKTVQISVPNNMTAGKSLRLKGLGLDAPRGEKGDLYLHFNHIDYVQETAMPPQYEKAEDTPKRRQEYVGNIKKCPGCGEEVPALTAICPACGHEFTSTKVTASLTHFIKTLDECDNRIAQEPKMDTPKKGFMSWDKKVKIGWITLNILTSFIPLVFYFIFPYIKPFFGAYTPMLTPEEKKKADLIENYAFPNEREAILEAILFIKSKIAFLATSKYTSKTRFWMNIWNTKAEQLQEKAKILLINNSITDGAHAEIVQHKQKVQRKVLIRTVVALGIVVGYAVFVFANGSLYRGVSRIMNRAGIIENSVYFEWYDTGLCTKLPDPNASTGRYWVNDDEELDVDIGGYSESLFEKYVTACKEKGFLQNAKKETHSYTAYNVAGDYLNVYLIGDTMYIELKAVGIGDGAFSWPDNEISNVIPKTAFNSGKLGRSNNEEIEFFLYSFDKQTFDEYVEKCKEEGFTVDAEDSKGETWYRYEAFNHEGYKLRASVDNVGELSIYVRIPRSKEPLSWPTSGPAKLIPKLKNCTGEVASDYDWAFSAYVTNMSIDDFNNYIEKCIKKGYVKDTRTDHYFSADKGEDISLTIEYIGFNTVYISIKDYDKF